VEPIVAGVGARLLAWVHAEREGHQADLARALQLALLLSVSKSVSLLLLAGVRRALRVA